MVDGSDLEEQCYSAHVETVEGLLDITNLTVLLLQRWGGRPSLGRQ